MNKIWIIIQREYRTRVKNKMFLISTFLLPIVFVIFIFGGAYLSFQSKDVHKFAVIDSNGFLKSGLKNDNSISFEFPVGVDSSNYEKRGYTDLLLVPEWDGINVMKYNIYSPKQLGQTAKSRVVQQIDEAIDNRVLMQNGFPKGKLDSIRKAAPKAEIAEKIASNGKEGKLINSKASEMIGFVSGILIYIMMFIYGAAVMRGVMEEKTNRIAEVVVSSVKPFQLMMGKIVGIGAVGLTQFLLWLILIIGLIFAAQFLIPESVIKEVQDMQQNGAIPGSFNNMGKASDQAQKLFELKQTVGTLPWVKIIFCFLFYFLGGYLFYAALFASVGCMVNEDPQEAQSLMLPITMPIIFGFIIMQGAVQNPNSSIAFWGSIIPFTSPIVMMARIPSDPPVWQIALSMLLLIGGFLGTGWMAGKIYRTGILMYGKKGSWKQMMKWVFAKS